MVLTPFTHLAARVGSIDYLHAGKRPELETLHSNLAIDVNVFRACLEAGIKKIVYSLRVFQFIQLIFSKKLALHS